VSGCLVLDADGLLDPVGSAQYLAEPGCLDDEDVAMELFGRELAPVGFERDRACGIGQELDGEAQVDRLPGRRVAA
jgi:hypothetical protein